MDQNAQLAYNQIWGIGTDIKSEKDGSVYP